MKKMNYFNMLTLVFKGKKEELVSLKIETKGWFENSLADEGVYLYKCRGKFYLVESTTDHVSCTNNIRLDDYWRQCHLVLSAGEKHQLLKRILTSEPIASTTGKDMTATTLRRVVKYLS